MQPQTSTQIRGSTGPDYTPASSSWISYSDSTDGFALNYPQEWKISQNYDKENGLNDLYIQTGSASDNTYKQIQIVVPATIQFKDQGSIEANVGEIQKLFTLDGDVKINLPNSVAYYGLNETPGGQTPGAVVVSNHQAILVTLTQWPNNNLSEAESFFKQFLTTIVFTK